jgi:hypothetical protein
LILLLKKQSYNGELINFSYAAMPPKRSDQKDIHLYVSTETYTLVRAIAAIRNQSINSLTTEALEEWLEQEEQQETIKTYNLERLIEPKD